MYLYLVVGAISDVAESPARIPQHFGIVMAQELSKHRKAAAAGLQRRGWVLIATQVGERPGNVSQKRHLQQEFQNEIH